MILFCIVSLNVSQISFIFVFSELYIVLMGSFSEIMYFCSDEIAGFCRFFFVVVGI